MQRERLLNLSSDLHDKLKGVGGTTGKITKEAERRKAQDDLCLKACMYFFFFRFCCGHVSGLTAVTQSSWKGFTPDSSGLYLS